jgi:hypothetical protein
VRRGATLALLALAFAGCGGDSADNGPPRAWQEAPRLITTPTQARVVIGRVANRSGDQVVLEPSDLKLLDQKGRRLPASAVFLSSFVKSNFPHNKGQLRIPEQEQLRLGQLAKIDPGSSVPLTVSWHEPPGPRAAARIAYGKGSLPVPRAPAR